MPRVDEDRRADDAGRYLWRAQALYQAAQRQQHLAVARANWQARRAEIDRERAAWLAARDRNQDWRAYHDQYGGQDQAAWAWLRERPRREAARVDRVQSRRPGRPRSPCQAARRGGCRRRCRRRLAGDPSRSGRRDPGAAGGPGSAPGPRRTSGSGSRRAPEPGRRTGNGPAVARPGDRRHSRPGGPAGSGRSSRRPQGAGSGSPTAGGRSGFGCPEGGARKAQSLAARQAQARPEALRPPARRPSSGGAGSGHPTGASRGASAGFLKSPGRSPGQGGGEGTSGPASRQAAAPGPGGPKGSRPDRQASCASAMTASAQVQAESARPGGAANRAAGPGHASGGCRQGQGRARGGRRQPASRTADQYRALEEISPAGGLAGPRGSVRWCGREDSNFHGLPHSDLNAARLPIPPRPLVASGGG